MHVLLPWGALLEGIVKRFVVCIGELAHLAIELELAQSLHRKRMLMLPMIDLGFLAGLFRARSLTLFFANI